MSGSDSDLNYESADEDAEFATNTKSKVTDQNSGAKNISEHVTEKNETFVDDISNAAQDTDSDKNKSISSTSTSSFKQISADVSQMNIHTERNENTDKSECGEKELQDHRTNVVTENKDKIATNASAENVVPETQSDEKVDAPFSKSEQTTAEAESPKEKQRVVLRREKLHQKKQVSKESPLEKEKASDLINILQDQSNTKQSWGFGSWGTSLLSTAASSVSTFSSQVSQGIGSVLETVESSLGAPAPEDLATILKEKKEAKSDDDVREEKSSLLPDVSSWTKMFENTGSKVIMGGLDTLELIGKKTMDILTEGDPGLRKKRAAFHPGCNLSEVLREAKARADEQDQKNESEDAEGVHFSQIFDEKQGLVHLEALEMLSKQSQAKFQRLLMRHSKNSDVKKRLEEIRSICENIPSVDEPSDCENFEDFEAVFKKYTLELSLPLNVESIIKTQRQISKIISSYEDSSESSHSSPKEIFQSAICDLAEFTAKCIETFHKVAELILVQSSLDVNLEQCATNLTGLTTVMCIEVNNLSSRYHKCLETAAEYLQQNASSENVDVNTLATNVYVEASNSNNYIQDAYQMLVPVLQVCLLEAIE